nr:immunoglobulin heavy chain junction region [Macaca mulatta]MOV47885.1 immunoglobulin heavy chain junction region [Macaca mulatta]MOV48684.1 immunoglobulin heavy chain junction region [Macaca mulatta]
CARIWGITAPPWWYYGLDSW